MRRLLALLLTGWALLGASWAELVTDPDPRVRMRAYRDVEGGEDAVAALESVTGALRDEDDARVRAAARDAMARLPLSEAELRGVLADSKQHVARAWSAYALGFYRSPDALQALLDAAQDPEDDVRREVYQSLGRLGDRMALPALSRAAVRDPSAALRAVAEKAALDVASGRGRGLDVSTELAILEGGGADDRVRAARALGRSGDWRAIEPLLAAAREGNASLQQAALLALGHLGNQQAVPELCRIVTESAGQVRYHAIAALAELGDESALPALEALLDDMDPTTRQGALKAIAWIASDDLPAIAARMLKDPVEVVRVEAVLALESLRHPGRVDALVSAAADPSPFVRSEAARILGEAGDAKATPTLIALLDDRDPLVQLSAADALARLGAVEALPALKKQLEKAKTPEQKELYEAAVNALER